jgi:hypothetical protein
MPVYPVLVMIRVLLEMMLFLYRTSHDGPMMMILGGGRRLSHHHLFLDLRIIPALIPLRFIISINK